MARLLESGGVPAGTLGDGSGGGEGGWLGGWRSQGSRAEPGPLPLPLPRSSPGPARRRPGSRGSREHVFVVRRAGTEQICAGSWACLRARACHSPGMHAFLMYMSTQPAQPGLAGGEGGGYRLAPAEQTRSSRAGGTECRVRWAWSRGPCNSVASSLTVATDLGPAACNIACSNSICLLKIYSHALCRRKTYCSVQGCQRLTAPWPSVWRPDVWENSSRAFIN